MIVPGGFFANYGVAITPGVVGSLFGVTVVPKNFLHGVVSAGDLYGVVAVIDLGSSGSPVVELLQRHRVYDPVATGEVILRPVAFDKNILSQYFICIDDSLTKIALVGFEAEDNIVVGESAWNSLSENLGSDLELIDISSYSYLAKGVFQIQPQLFAIMATPSDFYNTTSITLFFVTYTDSSTFTLDTVFIDFLDYPELDGWRWQDLSPIYAFNQYTRKLAVSIPIQTTSYYGGSFAFSVNVDDLSVSDEFANVTPPAVGTKITDPLYLFPSITADCYQMQAGSPGYMQLGGAIGSMENLKIDGGTDGFGDMTYAYFSSRSIAFNSDGLYNYETVYNDSDPNTSNLYSIIYSDLASLGYTVTGDIIPDDGVVFISSTINWPDPEAEFDYGAISIESYGGVYDNSADTPFWAIESGTSAGIRTNLDSGWAGFFEDPPRQDVIAAEFSTLTDPADPVALTGSGYLGDGIYLGYVKSGGLLYFIFGVGNYPDWDDDAKIFTISGSNIPDFTTDAADHKGAWQRDYVWEHFAIWNLGAGDIPSEWLDPGTLSISVTV